MFEADPIKAKYFYDNDKEKIKLNWFCYEYAFGLYDKIRNEKTLERYRGRHTQEQLTTFCVYFSKRMKKSIFDRLSNRTPAVIFNEDYVDEYYSKISSKERHSILKAAMEAWDELTGCCVTCPNRCISEMYHYCHMFDRLDENDSFR